MCVVSMIGDYGRDKFVDPNYPYIDYIHGVINASTKAEIEKIKKDLIENIEAVKQIQKDILELKELLKRAKQYDIDNNEPDCEIEDKVLLLKKIASLVGVDLTDVFKNRE